MLGEDFDVGFGCGLWVFSGRRVGLVERFGDDDAADASSVAVRRYS